MARLEREAVHGADLVFACIGPALEIFSRYSRVKTPDGREVPLAEYLEKVWEVVGRAALHQVLGTAEAQARNGGADLVFFVFDLLHLDELNLMPLPLADRKARLAVLLEQTDAAIRYSDHQIGLGPAFHRHACALGLEGIVSKRLDAAYRPGQGGRWLKTKCLNREEFVVVGWTDPEGSRPFTGALLLGYYDPDGWLVYAGRVGSGMRADQLRDLLRRLQPLETDRMPLDVAPPRSTRFGSPLVLSRVHWVQPKLVVEVKLLTWTEDGLLRQVVYEGIREDKPAREVVRPPAATKTVAAGRKF